MSSRIYPTRASFLEAARKNSLEAHRQLLRWRARLGRSPFEGEPLSVFAELHGHLEAALDLIDLLEVSKLGAVAPAREEDSPDAPPTP